MNYWKQRLEESIKALADFDRLGLPLHTFDGADITESTQRGMLAEIAEFRTMLFALAE